jgi:hypothetical protein
MATVAVLIGGGVAVAVVFIVSAFITESWR